MDRQDRDGDGRFSEAELNEKRAHRGVLVAAGAAAVAAGFAVWALKPKAPAGKDSAGPRYAWRDTPETVGAAVTIAAPADALYRRWRSFRDFDQFMPNVVEVKSVGGHGDAAWTVKGPANASFHFHTHITEDVSGKRIAWAAEGSPARHHGSVSFEEGPRGTKVTLEMEFDPPGGAVGMAAAKLVGMVNANDPRRVARQALKRLKQLVETGEVARSTGNEA